MADENKAEVQKATAELVKEIRSQLIETGKAAGRYRDPVTGRFAKAPSEQKQTLSDKENQRETQKAESKRHNELVDAVKDLGGSGEGEKAAKGVMSKVAGLFGGGGALGVGVGTGVALAGGGVLLMGVGKIFEGFAALTDSLENFEDLDTTAIKTNINDLLDLADDRGGRLAAVGDGMAFATAMAGIGGGLVAFSVGTSAQAISQKLVEKFEVGDWAEATKETVETLLSIPDAVDQGFLKKSLSLGTALAAIGGGLVAFSIGEAGQAISQKLVEKFETGDWAQKTKDNVETLLSISDLIPQDSSAFKEGGKFALLMGGISAGIMAFSFAELFKGLGDLATDDGWATKLKSDVSTLLEIADEVPAEDAASLENILRNIAKGVNALSGSKFFSGIAEWFAREDFATKTRDDTLTLLEIADALDADTVSKLGPDGAFSQVMKGLKDSMSTLLDIKGPDVIGAIKGLFGGGSLKDQLEEFTETDFINRVTDASVAFELFGGSLELLAKNIKSFSQSEEGINNLVKLGEGLSNAIDGQYVVDGLRKYMEAVAEYEQSVGNIDTDISLNGNNTGMEIQRESIEVAGAGVLPPVINVINGGNTTNVSAPVTSNAVNFTGGNTGERQLSREEL